MRKEKVKMLGLGRRGQVDPLTGGVLVVIAVLVILFARQSYQAPTYIVQQPGISGYQQNIPVQPTTSLYYPTTSVFYTTSVVTTTALGTTTTSPTTSVSVTTTIFGKIACETIKFPKSQRDCAYGYCVKGSCTYSLRGCGCAGGITTTTLATTTTPTTTTTPATTTVVQCYDSDGVNYYNKGYRTYGGETVWDKCNNVDPNYLYEMTCVGSTPAYNYQYCSYGCYDGACRSSAPTTTSIQTTTSAPTTTTPTTTIQATTTVDSCTQACSNTGRTRYGCVGTQYSSCQINNAIHVQAGDSGCYSGMLCCCNWRSGVQGAMDACESYGYNYLGCLLYANQCSIQAGGTGILLPEGNYLCNTGYSLCCHT